MNLRSARTLCAACACLLAAATIEVRAEPAPDPLAWAPADADAVLVLRDAGSARRTALGRAGAQALRGLLAGAPQTSRAWSAFARTLGYDEEEAFDALLGERFIVVARGIWSPEASDEWAVISEVDPLVERRIRERIASPPRELLFGMPVFALEQGRYSLLSDKSRGKSRIIIAPTASMALVHDLAKGMRRPGEGDALVDTPAAKRVRELGEADAMGWIRFPDEVGGWWGGVARFEEASASVRLVTALRTPMAPPRAWSLKRWRAASRRAALLVVEHLMTEDDARTLGLSGVLDKALGALLPLLERGEATHIAMLAIPREGGGVEVASALRAERPRAIAAETDALLARTATGLGYLASAPAPGHDFGGMLPASARIVRIGDAGGKTAPLLGATPVTLRWRLRLDEEKGAAGWWIAGVGEEAFDAMDKASRPIPAGAEDRPWLSFGVARPRLLLARFQATGPPAPPPLRGFDRFTEIRWSSWMEDREEILSAVEVRAIENHKR